MDRFALGQREPLNLNSHLNQNRLILQEGRPNYQTQWADSKP